MVQQSHSDVPVARLKPSDSELRVVLTASINGQQSG
jgi:hypothetical protein